MRFTYPIAATSNSFKNRGFRWLATGSGLNSAGMQGEQVIIGLLVYRMTESSAWVGVSLALFFAPMLFVGLPAGVLADRYDRRTVLITVEIALAVAMFVFALLLASHSVGLASALAMSVVSGVLRSVHHPARLSYAGDISGSSGLLNTLSSLSIVTRLGQLIGAIMAGLISEHYSSGTAYLVLAVGHVLASYCFAQMDARRSEINQSERSAADTTVKAIVEYLRLLRTSRLLLLLIVFASLVEVFGFSFASAMPEIAVERLTTGADGLGMMHALRSAGGLLGALILSMLIIRNQGRYYLFVMIGFGLALMLLAIAPRLTEVLIAITLVAVFACAADILVQSLLQLCVPDALRGRAMGAWVVALGMGPIGHLELGVMISLFGTTAALLVNGVILSVIGLCALGLIPSLREIRHR